MGNTTSNASGNGRQKTEAGVAAALEKCQSTLTMLDHSIATLAKREASHWASAAAARDRGDTNTALDFSRRAAQAAADVKSVRARHQAIERQKTMIEQQQLNMMLTGVLVTTSQVLQSTQTQMAGATDAVDDSNDVYHAIYDEMIEINETISATEDEATSEEEAALMAMLDRQMPPPTSPAPAPLVAVPAEEPVAELQIGQAPTPPTYTPATPPFTDTAVGNAKAPAVMF